MLVPTKLTAPQLNPLWVPRERLLARLNGGLQARLTLIVAPAGFGKSTLVAQWLAVAPGPIAWLNLDEHDQDPLRFVAYVAGAIARALPGALPTTHPLLAALEPPPLYVILQALLVDLGALPAGLTLVLDDYHTLTAEPIHQAVSYLLRHLPPTSRLVILSRADPPLTLARLRAEQELAEIRAGDLRFTYGEAEAVVAYLFGRRVDRAIVAALHDETDGWPIALQLAALAMLDTSRSPPPRGGSTVIAEYLAEEVFDRQPQAIQDALLALAVPERVCAGLAATLLGPPNDALRAEHLLEQLVRANLFLTPLDADGRWYRFHHLFRELLLRRLRLHTTRQAAQTLHLRAATWLEAEGLFEEAVRCYLAAGEEDAAGTLIERLLAPDLGRGLSPMRPAYWLNLLPERLIARRPGLTLLEARIGFATLNIPVLAASLGRLEALLAEPQVAALPPPWPTFSADLALLHAVLAYVQRRLEDAIPVLQAMLAREHGLGLTGQALMILGRAYVAADRYAEGVQHMEALRAQARAQQGLVEVGELSRSVALCAMHGLAGRLDALREEAEHLGRVIARDGAGDYWVCYAEANLGRAAYERSDLAAAARHFTAVVQRRYHTNAAMTTGALAGLAMIAALQGSPEAAASSIEEIHALAAEVGSPFVRNEAAGCAAQLALMQGDVSGALQRAEAITSDPHLGSSSWSAVALPQLSKAAALIAAGRATELARAEAVLADVLAQLEAQHNARPYVCALATLALLRQAQGRPKEALDVLEGAVAIAAPRGYLRAFADRGPALRPLLRALADRGKEPAYVARILGALQTSASQAPPAAPPLAAGLEVLTHREREILALLAERLSDKEIAERLVIAPNTVRKHTSTVYSKLGVNSRREAVEAARALGLLPALR